MKTGLINLAGKIDTYLKKDEKMKRKLVFIFPEDDRGKFLMVNNEMIEKSFITETTGNFFGGDIHLGFNISRTF